MMMMMMMMMCLWLIFVLQLTELEAEFESLPPGKPVQTRFLRSQQDLKAKMLERQALVDDQAANPAGENIWCMCLYKCKKLVHMHVIGHL